MDVDEIIEFDKKHIWHPYSSMEKPVPCYPVKRAEGVYLELTDGRKIIDGMSSWWSVIHGYNNPVLNEAIKSQVDKMSHVMFGGITHEPAVTLAEKVISLVPGGLEHIFFCDSGSVAVEVAMKMALQYWISKGRKDKGSFMAIRGGYHGDTWHAMSVCDPVTGMHNVFNGKLPQQYFVPSPVSDFYGEFNDYDLKPVIEILGKNHNDIAAFILEPVVQGAGGMKFYHSEFLKEVRRLCDKFDVLLIADEIATGFGRSGKMFACEHSGISPDILCMGKAITGGYMSFAATICTAKVANTISSGYPGAFMHGPTFMGNPLACATANASIDLLINNGWEKSVKRIEQQMKDELTAVEKFNSVKEARVLGAIGVVEMKEPVNLAKIQKKFVEQGIWIRPFGKLIYIMPPYIITKEELSTLIDGIIAVISG